MHGISDACHQVDRPPEARQRDYEEIHLHPQLERRERAQTLRSDNTSGIAGVTCQCWPDGRPMRWIAHTIIAKGHVLTNCFGVKKHGFEQARHLAIAARDSTLSR